MREITTRKYEFDERDVEELKRALYIMQALQSETNWTPYQELQPIERQLWDIASKISDIYEDY